MRASKEPFISGQVKPSFMEIEVSTVLLGLVLVGLLVNIWMQSKQASKEPPLDINLLTAALNIPSITDIKTALDIPTTETIAVALNSTLSEQGIAEKIGSFSTASAELKEVADAFNRNMLQKSYRAAWGEWAMGEELKETFPELKLREQVPELGKNPDAHLRVGGKILCIDSKFVFDAYDKYMATPETQVKGREKLLKTFEKDVESHVSKIKGDYVHPGKGTHLVAYMYIPSTSVYDFLITQLPHLMRTAASEGVIICSPATLMANMHMLRVANIASTMSSMHNEILDAHKRILNQFKEAEAVWQTLYRHANNLTAKVGSVQTSLTTLGAEIGNLERLSKSLPSADDEGGLLEEGGEEESSETE